MRIYIGDNENKHRSSQHKLEEWKQRLTRYLLSYVTGSSRQELRLACLKSKRLNLPDIQFRHMPKKNWDIEVSPFKISKSFAIFLRKTLFISSPVLVAILRLL